jgi:hypothetical protein
MPSPISAHHVTVAIGTAATNTSSEPRFTAPPVASRPRSGLPEPL